MKNIHVLPTDKPSNIVKIYTDVNKENYIFRLNTEVNDNFKEYVSIYITNDEEIKEGDYMINKLNYIYHVHDEWMNTLRGFKTEQLKKWQKIILTTDQDLIKDGVQAIDDEFLEWFVKNTSCESVEVKKVCPYPKCNCDLGVCGNGTNQKVYKIIIPKEEPKQETLEEVAERLFKFVENDDFKNYILNIQKETFIAGYQLAQQQNKNKYGEEDLKQAFFSGCYSERKIKPREKCWEEFIEQFKKK